MPLALNVMEKLTDQIAVVRLEHLVIRTINVKQQNVKLTVIVMTIVFALEVSVIMHVHKKDKTLVPAMPNALLETMPQLVSVLRRYP